MYKDHVIPNNGTMHAGGHFFASVWYHFPAFSMFLSCIIVKLVSFCCNCLHIYTNFGMKQQNTMMLRVSLLNLSKFLRMSSISVPHSQTMHRYTTAMFLLEMQYCHLVFHEKVSKQTFLKLAIVAMSLSVTQLSR